MENNRIIKAFCRNCRKIVNVRIRTFQCLEIALEEPVLYLGKHPYCSECNSYLENVPEIEKENMKAAKAAALAQKEKMNE